MKKTTIILFLTIILLTTLTQAKITPDYTYKKNTQNDNIFQCTLATTGGFCQPNYQCNLTLIAPNTTILIDNQAYTNNISYHNYTLTANTLTTLGDYTAQISCTNGTAGTSDAAIIRINNSGQETEDLWILGIYAGIIICSLIYIFAAFKVDLDNDLKKLYIKFVLFFSSFINLLGILFLNITIISDRFNVLLITEILFAINLLILLFILYWYFMYLYNLILSSYNREKENEY